MRGDSRVVELVDSAEWIGLPAIVLGELHTGFRGSDRRRQNEEELERFLQHPVVEELTVDQDVARVYAEILHALREKGTPIPTNDAWIAATAARSGSTVIAYDAHFAAIDRIGVIVLGLGA